MTSTLRRTSSVCEAGQSIEASLGRSPLDGNIFVPQPSRDRADPCGTPRCGAELEERLAPDRNPTGRISPAAAPLQKSSKRNSIALSARQITFLFIGFLPACFAANSFLLTAFCHLITLSARAKTFGGIVRPICFAAFRLMMNSKFFGCSTGRSAGLTTF